MGTLSIWHWAIITTFAAVVAVPPFWRITVRSGRNGALSLVILLPIPLITVLYLWFIAFARWPSTAE